MFATLSASFNKSKLEISSITYNKISYYLLRWKRIMHSKLYRTQCQRQSKSREAAIRISKIVNPLQTSPTFAANVSRGGTWRHSFSLPDSPCKYRSQFLEASSAAYASLRIACDTCRRCVIATGRYIDCKMICEWSKGMILHAHCSRLYFEAAIRLSNASLKMWFQALLFVRVLFSIYMYIIFFLY